MTTQVRRLRKRGKGKGRARGKGKGKGKAAGATDENGDAVPEDEPYDLPYYDLEIDEYEDEYWE